MYIFHEDAKKNVFYMIPKVSFVATKSLTFIYRIFSRWKSGSLFWTYSVGQVACHTSTGAEKFGKYWSFYGPSNVVLDSPMRVLLITCSSNPPPHYGCFLVHLVHLNNIPKNFVCLSRLNNLSQASWTNKTFKDIVLFLVPILLLKNT